MTPESFPDVLREVERLGGFDEAERCFLQALSIREAAGQMGISVANAKVLQYRALRMAAQRDAEGTS